MRSLADFYDRLMARNDCHTKRLRHMRTKNKFTSGHSALEKTNVLMNFEMEAPGIPGVVIALEIQLTLRYGAPR